MDLGLKGKTIIVTGGSGGIGRGLVQEFAAEGCRVAIATRDAVKGQEVADSCAELAGEAHLIKTDITDEGAVKALLGETLERFGPVEVLVNNAGGTNAPTPFLEKTRADCEWETDLNVWGVFNTHRVIGAHMVERGRGSIVNVTSNSALLGEAAAYVAHYGGTKGYQMSLSKALAFEWGHTGVRVNCISPGWIVPHDPSHTGEGSFWNKFGYEVFGKPDEMEKQAASGELFNIGSQPIPRVGRPEDIANVAVFLASDRASYVTGQLISVGGGSYMP